MRSLGIIISLCVLASSGFPQMKLRPSHFREISVLSDSISIAVPKYMNKQRFKYYSETMYFDTSLTSASEKELFTVYIHDFSRYMKKEDADTSIMGKLGKVVQKDKKQVLLCKYTKEVSNTNVGFIKVKYMADNKPKIYALVTFFMPDVRPVDIAFYMPYSKENLAALDYIFDSLKLNFSSR